MSSKFLYAALAALLAAALLSLAAGRVEWLPALPVIARVMRWAAIVLFTGYAARERSLTAWIFVGMAAGVEFGHDWPATALHLQILGTIFLRLIKVIIAPLLFSTLVVGIAGHAGGGNRRTCGPEEGRAHGRQSADLF